MDDQSYNIRVPKRWARIAGIVGVTALIVAPLTAVATHSFTDVPDSNTFHEDIAWLKDAAVTLGCNPPDNDEYCPDDNVTRGQMAAFMKRLAENQVVDAGTAETAETAGDADTVSGLTPAQVVSGFADSGPYGGEPGIIGINKLEEIQINAPADGYLQLYGQASFSKVGASTTLVWLQVDNTTCNNTTANITSVGYGLATTAAMNSVAGTGSGEGIVPITEGSHTITLCGNVFLGAPADLYGPSLSGLFLSQADISVGLYSESDSVDIPGSK